MHQRWRIARRSWYFPKIEIDYGFYLFMAMYLFLVPIQWVTASAVAALIHEMGHLIALWMWDIRVWKVQIGVFGAKIETEPLQARQELVCSLAGPLVGLLACLFGRWFPRLAIWAAGQSLFNLMPIYPLDGGRAVKSAIELWRKREYLEKSVANRSSSGYNNPN